MLAVAQNLAAMKLLGEDMPVKQAQLILLNFGQQLFTKYAREPHALLLKGQHDKAIKRMQVMRAAFDDLEFSPLPDFSKRIDAWREAVRRHYLALIREVPGAEKAAQALWSRDQYLVALLHGENPNPEKHAKEHAKEELSYIVLTAVKDTLGEQTLYLLAAAWQEKAERYQATWERLQKAGKAEAQVRRAADNAQEAWSNVCGWWKKYEERYPLAWSGLEPRFRAIQDRWQRGEQEKGLSLWDLFSAEVHRAAAARLFLAQAQQRLGQGPEAKKRLVKLEEELTALLKNPEIKKELDAAQAKVRLQGNSIQADILENLMRDLGHDGGFFWLREKVRRQLNHKEPKEHKEKGE